MDSNSRARESGADELWAKLVPRPRDVLVPATPTLLLWLSRLADAGANGAGRGMQFAVRLIGELDVEQLRDCLQALRQRHESLRSRIVRHGDAVALQVDADGEVEFDVVSLEHLTQSQAESEIVPRCEEFAAIEVDLSIGPLFAARLFRLSARDHVLIVAAEHSVTDEISNAVLHNELWTLYRQRELGRAFTLPSLPLQFGDYAAWLQQTSPAWWQRHALYWSDRLAGAPEIRWPCPLGVEELPGPGRYPMQHLSLGRELSEGLRRVAARERRLLALVVLTVHVAALSRWLQQRDLIVRFVGHGRYRPQLQSIVGFLACCLHLRIEVGPRDTLVDLLQRINKELQSAYQHHDFDNVPARFPDCVGELAFNWAARGALRTSPPSLSDRQSALRVEPFSPEIAWPRGRPYFARFTDTGSEVVASIHCQPGRFAPDKLDQFGENLRMFAAQFIARPLDPIG